MTQLPNDDRTPPRGRPLRRAVVVLLAAVVALVLAAGMAMALLRHSADANSALLLVHAFRPWFIAAQVAILGLAWHQWPRIVAAFARWRSLSPVQHDALLRGRTRIFLMLSACELLIVLRAFAG